MTPLNQKYRLGLIVWLSLLFYYYNYYYYQVSSCFCWLLVFWIKEQPQNGISHRLLRSRSAHLPHAPLCAPSSPPSTPCSMQAKVLAEGSVEGGVEGVQSGSGAWMALKEIFLFWGCSLIQKTKNQKIKNINNWKFWIFLIILLFFGGQKPKNPKFRGGSTPTFF